MNVGYSLLRLFDFFFPLLGETPNLSHAVSESSSRCEHPKWSQRARLRSVISVWLLLLCQGSSLSKSWSQTPWLAIFHPLLPGDPLTSELASLIFKKTGSVWFLNTAMIYEFINIVIEECVEHELYEEAIGPRVQLESLISRERWRDFRKACCCLTTYLKMWTKTCSYKHT